MALIFGIDLAQPLRQETEHFPGRMARTSGVWPLPRLFLLLHTCYARQAGHDAWYVEYGQVELADSTRHSCHLDTWLDEGAAGACSLWAALTTTPPTA